MKLSLYETMNMCMFLQANTSNPNKIIAAYKEEPEKWETLKASFPVYRNYLDAYPELVKAIRDAGIEL